MSVKTVPSLLRHTHLNWPFGNPIPYFLIFKGQRNLEELTEDATQGPVFTNMEQAE